MKFYPPYSRNLDSRQNLNTDITDYKSINWAYYIKKGMQGKFSETGIIPERRSPQRS